MIEDKSEEDDFFDSDEIYESYEPTEEEIEEHYRERAERYWENKR
jgi:hypothetical protein